MLRRKVKCKNCAVVRTEKGTERCHNCNISGCSNCIDSVCCDCGVSMCNDCRNNDDIKCGCYGTCKMCGNDVDRGSDGWPCRKCKKWLCNGCRRESKCKECRGE